MPIIDLTEDQKRTAEKEASRTGSICGECKSYNLKSRDTAILFGTGAVRVYMDCGENPEHDTKGAGMQFEREGAERLLGIYVQTPPPRRYPGETSSR